MRLLKNTILGLIIISIFVGCGIQPTDYGDDAKKIEETQSVTKQTDNTETPESSIMIYARENDLSRRGLSAGMDVFRLPTEYNYEFKRFALSDYDKYINDLRVKLLSNDDSFDIFFVYPSDMQCRDIIEMGYYVDLSKYDKLNTKFDLMFDTVKSMCTFDGEYFGFPAYIYQLYHVFDTKKLQEANISIDDINTYSDLIMYHNIINESEETTKTFNVFGYDFAYDFDVLCLNYDETTHHIDFSKIDLSSIKKSYKDIQNSSVDSRYDANIHEYIGVTTAYGEKNFGENLSIKPIYIDDSNPFHGVYSEFILINPNSKNIEGSVEYINAFGEYLKADGAPVVENDNFSDLIYKSMETYESVPFEVRKHYIYANSQILDDLESIYLGSKPLWLFPGYDECAEILQQYYDDEIEENIAKEQMQKIMDTVSREYTLD